MDLKWLSDFADLIKSIVIDKSLWLVYALALIVGLAHIVKNDICSAWIISHEYGIAYFCVILILLFVVPKWWVKIRTALSSRYEQCQVRISEHHNRHVIESLGTEELFILYLLSYTHGLYVRSLREATILLMDKSIIRESDSPFWKNSNLAHNPDWVCITATDTRYTKYAHKLVSLHIDKYYPMFNKEVIPIFKDVFNAASPLNQNARDVVHRVLKHA